VKFIKIAEVMV